MGHFFFFVGLIRTQMTHLTHMTPTTHLTHLTYMTHMTRATGTLAGESHYCCDSL